MSEYGIFGTFQPVPHDLKKLVAMFVSLPRYRASDDDEVWDDDANYLAIIQNKEEGGKVVELVHEDGQLGVVFSTRPRDLTPEQRAWMEQHGLEELIGERYFDYATNREEVETGPYNRYPVTEDEATQILLAILREFASIPEGERLLATTISTPDEWPVYAPDDWSADAPEL